MTVCPHCDCSDALRTLVKPQRIDASSENLLFDLGTRLTGFDDGQADDAQDACEGDGSQ